MNIDLSQTERAILIDGMDDRIRVLDDRLQTLQWLGHFDAFIALEEIVHVAQELQQKLMRGEN